MFGDEPEHADEETKDEPLKAAQATMTSTMKSGTAKKKKMVEIDPEEEERRKKEAAFQLELKTYGVSVTCFLFYCLAYLDLGGVLRRSQEANVVVVRT